MTPMLPSGLRETLAAVGSPMLGSAIEKFCSGLIGTLNAMKEYLEIDFGINEFTGGLKGGVVTELNSIMAFTGSQLGLRVSELVSQTRKPARAIERRLRQLKGSQRIELCGPRKAGVYFPLDFGVEELTEHTKSVESK